MTPFLHSTDAGMVTAGALRSGKKARPCTAHPGAAGTLPGCARQPVGPAAKLTACQPPGDAGRYSQPFSCCASCISRWRRLSARAEIHQPSTATSDTVSTSRLASALIFGLTPMRTEAKIFIGSVVELGPATKLAITTSSSDRVKASSQPDISAGAMIGRVIRKNTLSRFAPRSIAASSSERSSSCRREDTTTVTKEMVKVTCAIQIATTPLDGSPNRPPIDTSISRIDSPMITSGITSGAVTSAPNMVLLGKRLKRVIAIAAIVPITIDAVAVQNAIFRLTHAACSSWRSRNSSPYHLVENPAHTVASREELNEYSINSRIGRYRKAKPSSRTPQPSHEVRRGMLMPASLPARAAVRG